MKDWYRRTTWTKTDEEEFFQKLHRARSWGRPQYLMIQATTFVATGDPGLLDAAESLLAKYFAEYPDDKSNRSSCFNLLGDVHRLRRQFEAAIENYKRAVEFEKEYPNVQTDAFLQFAELVVKLDKRDHFKLAERVLMKGKGDADFPADRYRIFSLLAIICYANGKKEKGDGHVATADRAAAATSSGFQYHQSLGVVIERDAELDELVRKYNGG